MATTMKLIAKQTLTASAASVTFDNIPGTYIDLIAIASARTNSNYAADTGQLHMSINGVTTNRTWRRLYGANTAGSDNSTSALIGAVGGGTSTTASTFGNTEIYIPNYTGSTNKSFSVTSVSENNSSTVWEIDAIAGLWSSTAAITSLSFYLISGQGDLASGSSFFLYGLTKS